MPASSTTSSSFHRTLSVNVSLSPYNHTVAVKRQRKAATATMRQRRKTACVRRQRRQQHPRRKAASPPHPHPRSCLAHQSRRARRAGNGASLGLDLLLRRRRSGSLGGEAIALMKAATSPPPSLSTPPSPILQCSGGDGLGGEVSSGGGPGGEGGGGGPNGEGSSRGEWVVGVARRAATGVRAICRARHQPRLCHRPPG